MKHYLLVVLASLLTFSGIRAQSPGIIIRPAGGIGVTPLNPNGDGFCSSGSNGFSNNDITESEVQYKSIAPAFPEPVADLLRGPASQYSDLVRQVDGSGFYVFNDGTNMLFRLRMGNVVAGSKGYSVLIDTDGRFGNSGVSADPNFQAATNGTNGNPGFELEVVLETNFRVAIYNVDGTSSPVLLNSYPINTHSQISVALSTVSNTPDYFYDFYVPVSALGISAATPLRMTATTVMAPSAAIGGPKSDIFGVDDAAVKSSITAWENVINNQPIFNLTNITSGGSGVITVCTAAPVLNATLQAGASVSVGGTWTRLDATKPSTATITIYKNGVAAGTTTATSGAAWSIAGVSLSAGDIVYAQAQASGESQCLQSASVKVVLCLQANVTSTTGFTISCSSTRGMQGNRVAGTSVRIYQSTAAGITLFADDATTTDRVEYPTATTWRFDGPNGQGNPSSCLGGSNDVAAGTYILTVTQVGLCESVGIDVCLSGVATALPIITQALLSVGSTTLSGTAAIGATVRLYRNGKLEATTTATAGIYSFLGLALNIGDVVSVVAQAAGQCISTPVTRTVNCITATVPLITTGLLGNLSTSASVIAGISLEASGSIVSILENGVIIGTATVQANGTWSLNYTPIVTRSYTAVQALGSCAASLPSLPAIALLATTVCPTITGTYNSTASSISGTLPALFTGTVRLYLDGINIGSAAVVVGNSWSINVNTNYSNRLYPGAVVTASAQATGATERSDCGVGITIGCALPAVPLITPSAATILVGQATSISVTNSVSGNLYSITDVPVGITNYATSKFGVNGSLALPTYTFNSAGTFNVLVKAVSLDGPGCVVSASASITVNLSTLPVTMLYFKGEISDNRAQLKWATSSEQNTDHFSVERSDDGVRFYAIGRVAAVGNSNTTKQYGYTDQQSINQTAWYRLKMVDKDDKFTTSQVVRLSSTAKGLQVLSVLPNPFENDMQLNVQSEKSQAISIQLVDMTGREVFRMGKVVSAGSNMIVLSSLGNLSKGLYVLRVMDGKSEVYTRQVNKVR